MANNPLDPCSKIYALLGRSRQFLGLHFNNPFANVPSDSGFIAKATVVVLRRYGHSGPGKLTAFQLYSSSQLDPSTGRGKLSKESGLEHAKKTKHGDTDTTTYQLSFSLDPDFGLPGALVVTNGENHEFFLKFVILENLDGENICFNCNSWIYPVSKTNTDRVFFANTDYLPSETPLALQTLRKEELTNLRGNGTGKRMEWERVYDYAFYNDLGEPDSGLHYVRPVLGGSAEYPYPRRLRTGRPLSHVDRVTETRNKIINLNFYVPADEQFSPKKFSEAISAGIRAIVHFVIPEAKSVLEGEVTNFESFDQMKKDLYSGSNRSHFLESIVIKKMKLLLPESIVSEVERVSNAKNPAKFPIPQVIAADEFAWKSDDEFAREMLAGLNPVMIKRLTVFPPPRSSITSKHIEKSLGGLTIQQAMIQKRLFIVDHYDTVMPYISRINAQGNICVYASRTLLFLRDDSTLAPIIIELTLPASTRSGVKNRVFVPSPTEGTDAALWQLAKAHVAVNDSGYHQLISHFLHTHAAMEPFVIATRRQLSVMHPIHKLLDPHFKDTLHINSLARSILLNAGGLLEKTMYPGKYSLELSSAIYKNWQFIEQGLPADLLKRGVAVEDTAQPSGVRLLIPDYPYAVDGLEVYTAIRAYVSSYCTHIYETDEAVSSDTELQAWYTEIRTIGHGDTSASSWLHLNSLKNLIDTLTTIIWIASALHAAVNFGQFPYAGYMPNRPTMCRKFIPEEGTVEFAEFLKNPDTFFLGMITDRFTATLGLALIEVLSGHIGDEVYLGRRGDEEYWTDDGELKRILEGFKDGLRNVEKNIKARNADKSQKNRSGPAGVPYMLMYPDVDNAGGEGEKGITGRGIPTSVSV